VLKRTAQLQSELWAEAGAVAHDAPNAITSLFISSWNDTFDLSEKRLAALENRIPVSIWIMLLSISLLTCFVIGYSARRRFWMASVISPLMIAIVMGLVADLNSDRAGLIHADYRSLVRLESNRHSQ
jgi:hypothetical protein